VVNSIDLPFYVASHSSLHTHRHPHRRALALLAFFACWYAAITFVNHYNFRTYALDLGIYTNALYDYSHFQWNYSETFLDKPFHLLNDHFDLYLPLFSPLQFLFGSYTLLVVQWFFVCFGAWGFYRLLYLKEATRGFAIWGLLYYGLFFGIFAAFSFDYHSNVVVAALFPWWWWCIAQRKWVGAFFLLVAMCIGKENMPFWLFFVAFAGLIKYRSDRANRLFFAAAAIFSLSYFLVITQWVMPGLDPHGRPNKFEYAVLGSSYSEAFVFVLRHPGDVVYYLFFPQHPAAGYEWAKLEFWVFLFVAGGWALLLRPRYLIMIVPLVAQKMFHNRVSLWGVEGQYAIEFLPILGLAVFEVLERAGTRWKKPLLIIACVGTALTTIRIFDATTIWMNRSRLCVHKLNHYRSMEEVAELRSAVAQVPVDAVVSAPSALVPHLALRDHCYTFPKVTATTEWVIFSGLESSYPLSEEELKQQFQAYLESPLWRLQWHSGKSYVFQRVN
jgi:uncharacterized membrane protein